jgi:hypothetical protein
MAAHEHLNKILFHASTEEIPPHKQNKKNNPVFHVGTIKAAIDRVHLGQFTDDVLSSEENPQVNAYMHVYEVAIPENAHVYDDPSSSGYSDYHDPEWDGDNSIDERIVKEVTPYINRHEDYGSISYVIPKSSLKNKKTKYVGTMPFVARAEANDEERIISELGFN